MGRDDITSQSSCGSSAVREFKGFSGGGGKARVYHLGLIAIKIENGGIRMLGGLSPHQPPVERAKYLFQCSFWFGSTIQNVQTAIWRQILIGLCTLDLN